MGRTHALSGAAAWLVLVPIPGATTGMATDPPRSPHRPRVAAGAAMLPDLDHPQSTAGRALGPITHLLAVAMAALAGGHRQATHSLLGVVAVAITLASIMATPLASATATGVIGLYIGLALRSIGPAEMRDARIDLTLIVTTVAVVWWLQPRIAIDGWLPAAVGVGWLLHIVGDACTDQGVPWLWPNCTRHRLPATIRTGGPVERLTAGLMVVTIWLGARYLPVDVLIWR